MSNLINITITKNTLRNLWIYQTEEEKWKSRLNWKCYSIINRTVIHKNWMNWYSSLCLNHPIHKIYYYYGLLPLPSARRRSLSSFISCWRDLFRLRPMLDWLLMKVPHPLYEGGAGVRYSADTSDVIWSLLLPCGPLSLMEESLINGDKEVVTLSQAILARCLQMKMIFKSVCIWAFRTNQGASVIVHKVFKCVVANVTHDNTT